MTEQQQPFRGPQTPSTGATDEEEIRAARIANRFDIRRIIGGLFLLYGVILAIVGIVGSAEIKNKAAGSQRQPLDRPGHARRRRAHDLVGAGAPGHARARGHRRRGIRGHRALARNVEARRPRGGARCERGAPAGRGARRAPASPPLKRGECAGGARVQRLHTHPKGGSHRGL